MSTLKRLLKLQKCMKQFDALSELSLSVPGFLKFLAVHCGMVCLPAKVRVKPGSRSGFFF